METASSQSVLKVLRIVLLAGIVIAAGRVGWIFWERRAEQAREAEVELRKKEAARLEADYYVVPRKLRAYDLASARDLTKQPVWVRDGHRYFYYPYDQARKKADFREAAGMLAPIERLQITDVVTGTSPHSPQRQVLAVFEKEGRAYVFSVGAIQGDTYYIYADEMLYIQNPRELYRHWPEDVWQAVERGEVRKGMSELQVTFAAGFGSPERSGDADVRVVQYPRDGRSLRVTYRRGRVVNMEAGKVAE